MDDLRLHAVVARAVAWHNRHPLARRITAAQVNSVGYVALPYTAPGLPPPAPPVPPAPPAAPEVLHAPAPASAEPVDSDPVIETGDPGGIVIDVDPEPRAPGEGDSSPMTLEVELSAATPDAALAEDTPPGPTSAPETGPATGDSPVAADAPAADSMARAAKPVSSLRARAAASEGDAPSLPGAAPEAAPPATMPAPGAPRTLVCSEDFMAPVPVRQVLEWAHTHGVALPRDPVDGPVHQVPVDAALLPAGAGVGRLWVATAAVEVGGRRHRLLLGGGAEPAVLGRRAWSLPRLLGAFAVPAVLMVAAVVWLLWPKAPAAVTPTAAVLAAAGAVAPAAEAASAASAASTAAGAASAASAPAAPASAALADTEAPGTSAQALRLPALLDDAAKAQARAAVAAVRAERQASVPVSTAAAAVAPPPAALPTAPAAPASPAVQPVSPPAVVFGLSTRLLRTRAEAEQLQSAFQALLGGTPGSSLRVEMLAAGEDWRVVCWPYERRADAERARALLQARGLRVELVDF